MTKQDFYNEIEEFLELEDELAINEDTTIEDLLEIDSLAHITLISVIKDNLGVEIASEDFSKFETLGDMVVAVGEEKFN